MLVVVGTVVAAVADVTRTIVATVANVSAWVVEALTVVMEPMAGVADVADRIIGSLPRLRGDRDGRRGYRSYRQYCLGGTESHGIAPSNRFAIHTMRLRWSEAQLDLRRIAS
jgi:hypothetical protein